MEQSESQQRPSFMPYAESLFSQALTKLGFTDTLYSDGRSDRVIAGGFKPGETSLLRYGIDRKSDDPDRSTSSISPLEGRRLIKYMGPPSITQHGHGGGSAPYLLEVRELAHSGLIPGVPSGYQLTELDKDDLMFRSSGTRLAVLALACSVTINTEGSGPKRTSTTKRGQFGATFAEHRSELGALAGRLLLADQEGDEETAHAAINRIGECAHVLREVLLGNIPG